MVRKICNYVVESIVFKRAFMLFCVAFVYNISPYKWPNHISYLMMGICLIVEFKKEFQNLIARVTKVNIGPANAELKPTTQSSDKPIGLLDQSDRDTQC